MSWENIRNTYKGAFSLLHLVFPLSVVRVLTSTATPLDVAVLIYGIYYSLGFTLFVQPYLKRATGGTDRDKELPYLLIPLVILGFLLFIYTVGRDYFAHGIFPEGVHFSIPFASFLLSIAISLYYGVLLPKVFHHSFQKRSIIRSLTPLRTVAFILPAILGTSAIIWSIVYGFFVSVFVPSLSGYEMAISLAWSGILVYFAILGILNRVWLRPYLLRTKGRVSHDDQLPYFVIPTLITVLSVFFFDAYRYSLGSILLEHLRFSFTVLICSATILFYTGFILPRIYHFSFQEFSFTKPLSWNVLTGTHVATSFLLLFLIGAPAIRSVL